MKFSTIVAMFAFAVTSAQAAPSAKLACRAHGKIQSVQTVIVEATDLDGQVCAISSDKTGKLSFYVSNGDVSDAKILVSSRFVPMDGEYTVYLTQVVSEKGKTLYKLEEYFVCDENDQEFCYASNRKVPKLTKTESVDCKVVR